MKYTKEHEWINIENDDVAVVGITEFAQNALGDLVYVELPEVGTKVSEGDDVAVVESVKTASEIYSPVSGEIVEVNESLSDDPESMKQSLEGGWIFKVKMENPDELSGLMDESDYQTHIEEE